MICPQPDRGLCSIDSIPRPSLAALAAGVTLNRWPSEILAKPTRRATQEQRCFSPANGCDCRTSCHPHARAVEYQAPGPPASKSRSAFLLESRVRSHPAALAAGDPVDRFPTPIGEPPSTQNGCGSIRITARRKQWGGYLWSAIRVYSSVDSQPKASSTLLGIEKRRSEQPRLCWPLRAVHPQKSRTQSKCRDLFLDTSVPETTFAL